MLFFLDLNITYSQGRNHCEG